MEDNIFAEGIHKCQRAKNVSRRQQLRNFNKRNSYKCFQIFNIENRIDIILGIDIYGKNNYINITKNKQDANVEPDAKKEKSHKLGRNADWL